MRVSIAWLLLGLTACPVDDALTAGGGCEVETQVRCDDSGRQLLRCTTGTYEVFSDCQGPQACATIDQTAACDTSGNTVGAVCSPESEGRVRCDPDGGARVLRCLDRLLTVELVCPDGTRCGFVDGGLTCGA